MAKATYIVFSKPKPGREEDWNAWHHECHVHDVLRVAGFVSCRRFAIPSPPDRPDVPGWRFAAIYEVEADDPAAAVEAMRKLFGSDAMPTTDASDTRYSFSLLLEPCGAFVAEHAGSGASAFQLDADGRVVRSSVLNDAG